MSSSDSGNETDSEYFSDDSIYSEDYFDINTVERQVRRQSLFWLKTLSILKAIVLIICFPVKAPILIILDTVDKLRKSS